MKRDMTKTAMKAAGKIDRRFNMDFEELSRLVRMARHENTGEAIITAFHYGYILGGRAHKAGKYKE